MRTDRARRGPTAMLLRRCVVTAVAAACAATALAVDDPLRSAECRQALDALDAQERMLEGTTQDGLATWRSARRRAAASCLGREDAPPPQHVAQPPVRVAPVVVPPMPPRPTPAAPMPPVPAPVPNAPTSVTSCDPTGCWAADGTRLQRNGPDLVGPRGLCTLAGNVLRCP